MNYFPFFCNCVWVLHEPNRLSSATSHGFGGLQADKTWPFYQLFLWFYDLHIQSLYNSSNNLLYKTNYIKKWKISTKRWLICKIRSLERNSFLEAILLEESPCWVARKRSKRIVKQSKVYQSCVFDNKIIYTKKENKVILSIKSYYWIKRVIDFLEYWIL